MLIAPFIGLVMIFIALIILHHHTQNLTISMVIDAVHATPTNKIMLAFLTTSASFFCIGLNEIIAAQTMGKKLPWRILALAGSVGNALANTLGFHALTITAWRYKIYKSWGLNILDITHITTMTFIGVAFGFAGAMALALFFDIHPLGLNTYLGSYASQLSGLFLLITMIIFVWWAHHRWIGFRHWSIVLPDRKHSIWLIAIGIIDVSAMIVTCYILLPNNLNISFAYFTIIIICALLFGIISHTPGGIGVFEAGMMTALSATGRADVLAGLLLYRLIYNLLPFSIAATIVVIHHFKKPPQLERG